MGWGCENIENMGAVCTQKLLRGVGYEHIEIMGGGYEKVEDVCVCGGGGGMISLQGNCI